MSALGFFSLLALIGTAESYATGYLADREKQLPVRPRGAFTAGTLPSSFDWRSQQTTANPIKDQAQCGSCWAFATVAVLEYQIQKNSGTLVDLSEQQLVSCSTKTYGCNGGWMSDALAFYTDNNVGPATEQQFPYSATNGVCRSMTSNYKVNSWGFVGANNLLPTRDELKAAIYQNGPIAVAVAVDTAFQRYFGGVFRSTYTTINHAVVLVGWNDVDNYWIMRNSWGTSWGEAGYMRIGYESAGIGYAAVYANANTASQVASPSRPPSLSRSPSPARRGCDVVLGYTSATNSDAPGNDIGQVIGTVSAMATACNNNAACKAFNSNGWYKTVATPVSYSAGTCLYTKSAASCNNAACNAVMYDWIVNKWWAFTNSPTAFIECRNCPARSYRAPNDVYKAETNQWTTFTTRQSAYNFAQMLTGCDVAACNAIMNDWIVNKYWAFTDSPTAFTQCRNCPARSFRAPRDVFKGESNQWTTSFATNQLAYNFAQIVTGATLMATGPVSTVVSANSSEPATGDVLVARSICFGAQHNQSTFTLPHTGVVTAIRLVYKNGGFQCDSQRSALRHWGCDSLLTAVVSADDAKKDRGVVWPAAGTANFSGFAPPGGMGYSLAPYTSDSAEIIFNGPAVSMTSNTVLALASVENSRRPMGNKTCADVYVTYQANSIVPSNRREAEVQFVNGTSTMYAIASLVGYTNMATLTIISVGATAFVVVAAAAVRAKQVVAPSAGLEPLEDEELNQTL